MGDSDAICAEYSLFMKFKNISMFGSQIQPETKQGQG